MAAVIIIHNNLMKALLSDGRLRGNLVILMSLAAWLRSEIISLEKSAVAIVASKNTKHKY